jgi:hypothetical protein
MVESIQAYVNAYYSQFDDQPQETAGAAADGEASLLESQAETIDKVEPQAGEAAAAISDAEEEGMPATEDPEAEAAAEPEAVEMEDSGTIENAGSPVHIKSETAGTKDNTGE